MNILAGVITPQDTQVCAWPNVVRQFLDLNSTVVQNSFRATGTRIGVCASWVLPLTGNGAVGYIAAQYPLLFWNTTAQRYQQGQDLVSLGITEVVSKVQRGLIVPAGDMPWLAVDDARQIIWLFASSAGASTMYSWTDTSGTWTFSDRPHRLPQARDARLDRLGIAEIVRFGANYGVRTPLQSLRRIPFGHYLQRTAQGREVLNPYIDLTYQPSNDESFCELMEQTKEALELNLQQFSGANSRLLFSGGVDSSLLAVLGQKTGTVTASTLLSMGSNDPQAAIAKKGAASLGLDIDVVNLRQTWEDVENAIRSYALPTLDFSIIPTLQVGIEAVEEKGASVLFDGTGGDAWFGFGGIKHAGIWRKLNPGLRWLRRPASWLFAQRLQSDASCWLYPMMLAARMPTRNVASLGHLCANVAYREQLKLLPQEWDEIEDSTLALIGQLCQNDQHDDLGQVIVSDAAMIAMAQFGAKTSQWPLREKSQTVYPFCMPNMIAIGRKLPPNFLVQGGVAKPILKGLAVRAGFSNDYVFRKKSGFQPPLHGILSNPNSITRALDWLEKDDELNEIWTNFTPQAARRILASQKHITIKALYVVWSLLSIRIWLADFRRRKTQH